MTRRTLVISGLGGLALAAAAWALTGRAPDDPEAQVRRALDDAARAAERRDLAGVLDVVSDRFRGHGMDKDALRGLVFVELRRSSWRKVVLTGTEVSFPSEGAADVHTRALLARGEGLVPADADRWDFDLGLAREDDGRWRVVRAEWHH